MKTVEEGVLRMSGSLEQDGTAASSTDMRGDAISTDTCFWMRFSSCADCDSIVSGPVAPWLKIDKHTIELKKTDDIKKTVEGQWTRLVGKGLASQRRGLCPAVAEGSFMDEIEENC